MTEPASDPEKPGPIPPMPRVSRKRKAIGQAAKAESSRSSDEADVRTKRNMADDRKERAKSLSPGQRADVAEGTLRNSLTADLDFEHKRACKLQEELDVLRPKYAKLEQAADNARESGHQVTVLGVVGTSLVALGDLWPTPFDWISKASGTTCVIMAAVHFYRNCKVGWPKGR